MMSRSASAFCVKVGLITSSPLMRATRTSEIGPANGTSDTASAAEAASPASASGIMSLSAEMRLTCTNTFGVEVRREQRAQRAVDQSRNQDFVIRRAGLTLEEASGETARSGVFLFVFDRQRHEIAVGFGLLGGNYGGQQHRVPLFHNDRPVGLLR